MSCNIFKPKTLRILRNSVYCKFPLCISEWTCWAFQDLGEKSDKRHPSPRHAWQRCKFADCTLDFSRLGKQSTWGPAVLLLKFGRTASQNFAWLLFVEGLLVVIVLAFLPFADAFPKVVAQVQASWIDMELKDAQIHTFSQKTEQTWLVIVITCF